VLASKQKRKRIGTSTSPGQRLKASYPNHVWALDFIFDCTSDGRPLKALSMCDEFTRESLASEVARSITADDVIRILKETINVRGMPKFIRFDNGPEFTSKAIRDFCSSTGLGISFIEPGSPWQNPYVESFNARVRDELFDREVFTTVLEAKVLYEQFQMNYNKVHPHSALDWKSPEEFYKSTILGGKTKTNNSF
jgi:putative transposase